MSTTFDFDSYQARYVNVAATYWTWVFCERVRGEIDAIEVATSQEADRLLSEFSKVDGIYKNQELKSAVQEMISSTSQSLREALFRTVEQPSLDTSDEYKIASLLKEAQAPYLPKLHKMQLNEPSSDRQAKKTATTPSAEIEDQTGTIPVDGQWPRR